MDRQLDDDLLVTARRELFTAVVGDVMDQMHLRQQFLPPHIKPLDASMVVVGYAMPVLEEDLLEAAVAGDGNAVVAPPFGLMFRALDDLAPREVYVCTGASPNYALWGELMSVRASALGCAGAVVNGYSRDTRELIRARFPTFSYGGYAQDQGPRGRVVDFRVSINIEGVAVDPGDLVFGDLDGVCIVPRGARHEVTRRALEKVRGEQRVRRALSEGMNASDAFDVYGIM